MIRQYTTPVDHAARPCPAPQDEESGFSTRTETPATQSSEGNSILAPTPAPCQGLLRLRHHLARVLLLFAEHNCDRLAVIGHPERPAVDEILAEHWIVRSVRHITQVAGLFRVVVDSSLHLK